MKRNHGPILGGCWADCLRIKAALGVAFSSLCFVDAPHSPILPASCVPDHTPYCWGMVFICFCQSYIRLPPCAADLRGSTNVQLGTIRWSDVGSASTTLTQRRCSVLPCRRNPSHPRLTYWTDVRQGRAGEPRGELVLLVNNHPACGPLVPKAPGYLTYHA